MQLSETPGGKYETTAEHLSGSADLVVFGGQVIFGGCESVTVTVNEHDAPPLIGSAQLTVVTPTGKSEPDEGEQLT